MESTDALLRLLETMDVRRAPYGVAEVCAKLLECDPNDVRAGSQYVRALAVLGLGAAARRMLAALPGGGEGAAEIRAVLAPVVEGAPAGVIPWSSRRRRFQANLRALAARGVDAAVLLAAWEDPAARHAERYELHQAADGNFFVADRGGPGGTPAPWKAWLGGTVQDFKADAMAITRETFENKLCGPLAFDGMGYGWFLPRLLQVTERSFLNYSAAMYIVEPDLAALCMALHMHDVEGWNAGEGGGGGRLRVFVGEGAAEHFTQSLRDHRDWTLPASVVTQVLRPRPALDLPRHIEAVGAARAQERRQVATRIAAHYAAIDAPGWRKRYAQAAAGGPPLRVLGITTRYSTVLQYSMEELRRAAAAGAGLNLQMEICIEPDDQSLEKDYLGMIDRLKPDLLVMISRLRHEVPDLPRNIPALCWDQDNLPCMRDPAVLADLQGLTFVAGHGALLGATDLHWPLEACIFCHPAGMTHRYVPGEPSAEDMAQYGGEFSYVSHASGLPETLRDSFRPKWQAGGGELRALFEECTAQVIHGHDGKPLAIRWDYQPLIREVARQVHAPLTPQVEHELTADLRLLADRVFRHETLEWVARWCQARGKRLRLWGNGWQGHPTLAKWAAGAAVPGGQAEAVYRATQINLQIIGTGLVHSRLLDGWAAGGFFLIRRDQQSGDDARSRTRYRIGQLAAEEDIRTLADLEARGSAELRASWAQVAADYATRRRDAQFSEFRIWRNIVPAAVLFPDLERLLFNSAEEFATLADAYCDNPALRREVAEGIRRNLLAHFSYDARWRQFIGHMTRHMGYAAAPAPAAGRAL